VPRRPQSTPTKWKESTGAISRADAVLAAAYHDGQFCALACRFASCMTQTCHHGRWIIPPATCPAGYGCPQFAKAGSISAETHAMIRKLPSGKYRLYSRKTNPKTGKRRNLGTFSSRAAAEKHERAVQYFKRH
jgi:hypothetical protein